MPASNFPEYARAITDILDELLATGEARLVSSRIDQRSTLRGFMSGMVLFNDGSEIHFREFVDLTMAEPRLTYAYHYQDAQKALVFRYDNAAHRPPLSGPGHKHRPGGITDSLTPTLAEVIEEVRREMPGQAHGVA